MMAEGRERSGAIESLSVTFILILFTVAVFLLISAGSGSYKSLLRTRESMNSARAAVSYITVKIRQNDTAGSICILSAFADGQDCISIEHKDDAAGMITYLFYIDGALWESFIEKGETPGKWNAMKVTDAEQVYFKTADDGKSIHVEAAYGGRSGAGKFESDISLRSVMRGETFAQ